MKLWTGHKDPNLEIECSLRERNTKLSMRYWDFGKSGGIECICQRMEPVSQLNPPKKIFETIQPGDYFFPVCNPVINDQTGFIMLESREAAWIDLATNAAHRIMTKLGSCTAPTFVGASLS